MYRSDLTSRSRRNSRSSLAQTDEAVRGGCACKALHVSPLPAWLSRCAGRLIIVIVSLSSILAQAGITITAWEPMFKGIEHASGQATVDANTLRQQAVQALRVDL